MTRLSIDATQPARTQHLPTIAPDVRTPGNSGADAFGDLFAEKIAPPSESATEAESVEQPTDDTESSAESEETEGEASDNPGDDQANNSDRPTDQHADVPAETGGQQNTDDRPIDRPVDPNQIDRDASQGTDPDTAAVDPRVDPASGVQTNPEAAAAVAQSGAITDQAQVRQELKNAAVVDLSSLARSEMLGRVEGSRPTPPPTDGTVPKPDQPATPPPAPPTNESAAGRGGLERTGLPTPGQTPPPVDKGAQPQDAAPTGVPFGKNPNPGGHPLSAPGAARTAGDPPPEAKQQTTENVSKVAILDRLVNQSAARRGAVASVDRVHQAIEPGSAVARKAVIKQADAPKMARDVFLSPVQRGLGKMLAEGGGKMTVMLRPRELGDVKIAMETERGAVRVRMEASTDMARKTLEAGLESLRGALESKGVRVESMEVNHTPSGHGASADTGRGSDDPGRFGQPHRHQSDEGQTQQDAADTGQPGDEPRGIWTELGIDAVA